MCIDCLEEKQPPQQPGRRRKLWEIDDSYHCSIIGTCLSLRDLQKIANRSNITLLPEATEYAIHVTFVNLVSQRREIAKQVNKLLDRKFRSALDATRRIRSSDELFAYWKSHLKNGQVPGAYWATISHGQCDVLTGQVVFGDVHMLSHMVGAANRADLKRLSELEDLQKSLSADLEDARIRNRQMLAERNEIIAEQRRELAEHKGLRGRLVALEAQLAQSQSVSKMTKLMRKSERLSEECEGLKLACEQANSRLEKAEAHAAQISEENMALRARLERVQLEADNAEALLQRGLGPTAAHQDDAAASAPIDLEGATVSYIGGRASQICRLRSFVEMANGTFLHHDGGLEDGGGQLHNVLSRGDIVMCPIDCVSHSACTQAKAFCKRAGKCFVPLRSSGLTSFVHELKTLSETEQF